MIPAAAAVVKLGPWPCSHLSVLACVQSGCGFCKRRCWVLLRVQYIAVSYGCNNSYLHCLNAITLTQQCWQRAGCAASVSQHCVMLPPAREPAAVEVTMHPSLGASRLLQASKQVAVEACMPCALVSRPCAVLTLCCGAVPLAVVELQAARRFSAGRAGLII